MLGDFGEVDLRNNAIALKTEQGNSNASGNDEIHLGSGNDSVLGGLGSDTITSDSGNTHVIADNGELNYLGAWNDSSVLASALSMISTLVVMMMSPLDLVTTLSLLALALMR
ncbi:hypothetical protein JCM19231_5349 [Vibrio ishigakensis]|uniref:Alkaline phosphatase n=1 Tax=Vibrio ishigakensis TaxID=1481914 RepID=A0A0B8P0U5_9VIBR|nr:hypothetical protein JCM19231_5349 [Vibrio ishigakensis]